MPAGAPQTMPVRHSTCWPERGAIDHALAGSLRVATRLRNSIAHGYAMLDYRRVQIEAHEGLPALRGFLAAVAQAAGL